MERMDELSLFLMLAELTSNPFKPVLFPQCCPDYATTLRLRLVIRLSNLG
jgi:hypothetical protein